MQLHFFPIWQLLETSAAFLSTVIIFSLAVACLHLAVFNVGESLSAPPAKYNSGILIEEHYLWQSTG